MFDDSLWLQSWSRSAPSRLRVRRSAQATSARPGQLVRWPARWRLLVAWSAAWPVFRFESCNAWARGLAVAAPHGSTRGRRTTQAVALAVATRRRQRATAAVAGTNSRRRLRSRTARMVDIHQRQRPPPANRVMARPGASALRLIRVSLLAPAGVAVRQDAVSPGGASCDDEELTAKRKRPRMTRISAKEEK